MPGVTCRPAALRMPMQRSGSRAEAEHVGPRARMSANLQAPARSLASWTIGAFGMAGLVLIIAGVYTSPEALLAVAVIVALAVGAGWPHFLRIPAKKTLAAVIALPGVGSALAAAFVPAPGFLDWTPAFL